MEEEQNKKNSISLYLKACLKSFLVISNVQKEESSVYFCNITKVRKKMSVVYPELGKYFFFSHFFLVKHYLLTVLAASVFFKSLVIYL